MSVADWYIFAGNREQGPFTAEQIRAFVDSGKLKPNMGLRKEGMADCVPAGQVKGLFDSSAIPATRSIASGRQAPARPQPVAEEPAPYADEADAGQAGYEDAGDDHDDEAYDEMVEEDLAPEPEPEPEPKPRGRTRGRTAAAGGGRRGRRGATADDGDEEGGTGRRSRRGAGAGARGGKGRRRGGRGGADDESAAEGSKTLAIIGLVLILVGAPAFWIPIINFGTILFAVIGLILALIGRRGGGALATVAMILGLIVVGLAIAWNVMFFLVVSDAVSETSSGFQGVMQEMQQELEGGGESSGNATAGDDPGPSDSSSFDSDTDSDSDSEGESVDVDNSALPDID